MINTDYTLLKQFIDKLEGASEEINDQWIARDRVTNILKKNQMKPKFFRDFFGVKIYAYFINIIKGESEAGNCPVVHVMLKFCEDKEIKLHDVYTICSELKNIVAFYFTKNMYGKVSDDVFWKLMDLLDYNFIGVIKEYMNDKCVNIYSCKDKICNKLKIEETTQDVVHEKSKIQKHRFNDIRFTKEEKYNSTVLFDMLDDTVIDKIERFMDDLNYLLLKLYDIEEADTEKSIELMSTVPETIQDFYILIDTLLVFPVMVNTFQNLSVYLSELTVSDFEKKEKKDLFMMHLIGLVNDLEKWMDIVFIKRIADDVHYLDASFANNVVELESIFDETEVELDDEDDLEFF